MNGADMLRFAAIGSTTATFIIGELIAAGAQCVGYCLQASLRLMRHSPINAEPDIQRVH